MGQTKKGVWSGSKKSPVDPDTASYKPTTKEKGDQALHRMGRLWVLKAAKVSISQFMQYYNIAMLKNTFDSVKGKGHLLITSLSSSYSAQHPNQVLQYQQSVKRRRSTPKSTT